MRRTLPGATPAVFFLAVAHALAQQPIATPILSSDENFRDIAGIASRFGGTGFAEATAHDGVMRTGVLYRSEMLNVSDADLATLSARHITRDIDLRTPSEIAATPDRVPPVRHTSTPTTTARSHRRRWERPRPKHRRCRSSRRNTGRSSPIRCNGPASAPC
jgi:hypothetical protein